MRENLVGLLLTITIVATIGLVGTGVISELDESTAGFEEDQEAIVELNGAQWVTLADGAGTDETVVDSRGLAMKFDGSDESYVASNSPLDVASDTTWTVSQPVLTVEDTSKTQTVLAVGDPNLIVQYVNNSSGTDQWSAVYVTTTDSYRINVSAPSAGDTSPAFVYVTRENSNLTIYRNTTQGESVDITTSNALSGNLTDDSNCNCTLDETRTFDDVLNASQRKSLRDNPVAPLPGTNRTTRLMYDEGDWTKDTVKIFWSPVDATRGANTSYVDGFDGHELHPKRGLLNSDDYAWEKEGPQIRPLGEYQDAPALYVDYTFEGTVSQIRQAYTDSMNFVDIAFLVLMFSFIIGVMMRVEQAS